LQSSIRNRRSDESNFKLGKPTFTRFRKVTILIGVALILTSCSHINKTKSKTAFKSLCLSGGGKGRITLPEGKYVFSYESLLKEKEEEWLLGLELALHGEEVLKIKFKDALDSKVSIGGSFFKRLRYAAKKEKRGAELALIKKVLIKMGVFLKTVHMVRIGDYPCKDGLCHNDNKHPFSFVENADGLKAEFPFDSNHKFIVEARSNSSYYRKINFVLIDIRRRRAARQPFSLSLIHRQCVNV
jgi:hypothetical protein